MHNALHIYLTYFYFGNYILLLISNSLYDATYNF